MQNLKIKVNSESESKEAHELFFELGYMVVNNMDYEKGKIFVNMNPKIADANVFFNASIYSSFYQGEWNYSTFRGPTNRGELKITKNN